MSFNKGWRNRRAAAQHRALVAAHGSNLYRQWAERQRENERRVLRGEPPLVDEPIQQMETPAEAKARRDRDAIIIPTMPDDLDDSEVNTPQHRTIN